MNTQLARIIDLSKNSFLRNSAIYGIGLASTQLFNLVTIPIFYKYFGASEFGLIAIFVNVATLISYLSSLGLSASIGAHYFDLKEESERKVFLSQLSAILLISTTLIFFSISWALKWYLSDLNIIENQLTLLPMIFSYVFLTNLTIPFECYYKFENKSVYFAICSFASNLISFGLAYMAVEFFSLGLMGYLGGMIAQKLITFVFFVVPIFSLKSTGSTLKKNLLGAVSSGAKMVPGFLSLFFLQFSGPLLLKEFSTLSDTGSYHIGATYGAAINFLISPLSLAWFPYFMSLKEDRNKEKFAFIYKLYHQLIGSVAVLISLTALVLSFYISNNQLQHSLQVTSIVSAGYFFMGVFNLLLPKFYYEKKIEKKSFAQLLGLIVFLAIIILERKKLSPIIVAFAFLIANAFIPAYLYLTYVSKDPKISFRFVTIFNLLVWTILLGIGFYLYIETSRYLL